MALPYGAETSVDFAKSQEILDMIGNDFYNVTTGEILDARNELANVLGLTEYVEVL